MSTDELETPLVPQRLCPVCLARKARVLFHQVFSAFSEGGLLAGYDLVVCANAGLPTPTKFPPA